MPKLIHNVRLPNGDLYTVGRPITQTLARSGVDESRRLPKTIVNIPAYAKDKDGNVMPSFVALLPPDLIDVVLVAIYHWDQEGTQGEPGYVPEHIEVFGVPYTAYLKERTVQDDSGAQHSVLRQRLLPAWQENVLAPGQGVPVWDEGQIQGPDGPPVRVQTFKKKPGSGIGYFEKNNVCVRREIPIAARGEMVVDYVVSFEEMQGTIQRYAEQEEAIRAAAEKEEEEEEEAEGETAPAPTAATDGQPLPASPPGTFAPQPIPGAVQPQKRLADLGIAAAGSGGGK